MTTSWKFYELSCLFAKLQECDAYGVASSKKVRKLSSSCAKIIDEYLDSEKCADIFIYKTFQHNFSQLLPLVFVPSFEDYLETVIPHLHRLFPFEVEEMLKFNEVYSFKQSYFKRKNICPEGYIHEGKTVTTIIATLCYLASGRDVIILTRNRPAEREQLLQRLGRAIEILKEQMGNNLFLPPIDKLLERENSGYGKLHVVHFSNKNIEQINKEYADIPEVFSETVVFSDEVNSRDEEKSRSFIELRRKTTDIFTVLDAEHEADEENWRANFDLVTGLSAPKDHIGVNDVAFRMLQDEDEFEECLFFTLCDIAADPEPRSILSYHPKIILLTVSHTSEEGEIAYDQIKENKFLDDGRSFLPEEMGSICVIIFTGKGLQMFHPDLHLEEMFEESLDAEELASGDFLFSPRVDLSSILLFLAQNGGAERFPNIIIIGEEGAGRETDLACYDDFDGCNNWHVTHQILMKSDNSSRSTLLQNCRALGAYRDKIRPKIYCPEKDALEVIDSFSLSENTSSVQHKISIKISREDELMSLMIDNFPKCFLARKPAFRETKVIEISQVQVPLKEDGEQTLWTLRKWKSDLEKEAAGGKRAPKIAHMISQINAEKTYTSQELQKMMRDAGLKTSTRHLLVPSREKGYAKIFQKSGEEYVMFPEVAEVFRDLFC